MGSISPYTNAKGETLYRIVFRDAQHKQTSRRGYPNQKAAKLALAKFETQIDEGQYVPAHRGKKTVGSLADAWFSTKKATVKESSYAALDASWRNHVQPRWADEQIGKIKREDVQEWVNGMDRSPSIKRRAVEILAGILDTAVPANIKENPARGVKLPPKTSQSRHRYLTHEQLWQLAEAAGEHKLMILVLGYCGIRWGELTALTVDSLDPEKQLLHVERNVVRIGSKLVEGTPKSHKVRRVPVPTAVWELLRERAEGMPHGALLFGNAYGNFISPPSGGRSGRNWFNSALKKAGIAPMRIHDLRHTAASLAVNAGANVKEVQRMLGHRSAAVTLDIYSGLFDEDFGELIGRLDSGISGSIVAKSVAK